jgi:hypothetical protein
MEDGKICDLNAFQYPVEVDFEKDFTIKNSDFKGFQCLFGGDIEPNVYSNWNLFVALAKLILFNFNNNLDTLKVDYSLLIFDDYFINDHESIKGKCRIEAYILDDAYKTVKLEGEGEKLYVSTLTPKNIFGGTLRDKFFTFVNSQPGYKLVSFDKEVGIPFVDCKEGQKYRIIAEDKDRRIEMYIEFTDIGSGEVKVLVGSGGWVEGGPIGKGQTETFFENIELKFARKDGKDIYMTIKVKDPDCHNLEPSDTSPYCGVFCENCFQNPFHDLKPKMCCYQGEDCIRGTCENYIPPVDPTTNRPVSQICEYGSSGDQKCRDEF